MISRRSTLALLPGAMALGAGTAHGATEPAKRLRVGFQKGAALVVAARQNRSLETLLQPLGIDVEWLEFAFGPPLLEAMRVGSVDIGSVGDTPPIFAQAARANLLYVAAAPSGASAILLPPNSTLQTLHDLKDRKIAFARGSSAHNLTVAALEKAGLRYDEIEPMYLAPADAAAAFERGNVDAWTVWDPYYALYEDRPGVRVLAKSTDISEQNSFFIANGAYTEANPQIVARVVSEFARVGEWAAAYRSDVARLVSDGTGVPFQPMLRSLERNPLNVVPMSEAFARSQQENADRFHRLGLIPRAIRVRETIWHPSA